MVHTFLTTSYLVMYDSTVTSESEIKIVISAAENIAFFWSR